MKIEPTALPGVLIVEPERFSDARGFFQETWHRQRYAEAGIDASFVQDNVPYVPTSGSLVTGLRTIKASGRVRSINIQVSSVAALSTMITETLSVAVLSQRMVVWAKLKVKMTALTSSSVGDIGMEETNEARSQFFRVVEE